MQITVRFATHQDIEALKQIWEVCFWDERAYIDLFFQHRFDPKTTVVACAEQAVVGVIYMLPANLKQQKFMYGYAIGVLPEFRGNNICEKMHEFIKERAEKEQFLYGLHPANEKLFSFYRKIGLSDLCSLRIFDGSSCEKNDAIMCQDIDADTYFSLREAAFSPLISWDKPMIAYMLLETEFTGGFAKKITVLGNERIVLGKILGDTVYVKETTMTDKEILNTSKTIKDAFGAKNIIFLLPNHRRLGKEEIVVLGFGEKRDDVYMNLFLD